MCVCVPCDPRTHRQCAVHSYSVRIRAVHYGAHISGVADGTAATGCARPLRNRRRPGARRVHSRDVLPLRKLDGTSPEPRSQIFLYVK